MIRSFSLRTYGCQMNEHDSERIAGLLEADGMVQAASEDQADVIVLNTCCIRENADNRLYSALGDLKAHKEARPGLQVAVAGCLAQKDRDLIQQRAGHVDVVFGTHNVHRAAELLNRARDQGPVMEILEETVREDADTFPSVLTARREQDHRAWVTIQIGCDNSCSFCIVPAVRGSEMSRHFGDLIAEVEMLVANGVTEVTLLGQNVNSYGRDLTTRLRSLAPEPADAVEAGSLWAADDRRRARPLFADLLVAVGAVEGIHRVRFTSPHPKDQRPETVAAMADTPAVCEHLHLPIQSGSDRVLTAMHRGYTADRYLERLAQARSGIEDLAVTSDLIVGFPGETEADFEATLEVVAEAAYDSAYLFVFSPREGTEAAEMTGDFVDHAVSVSRFDRLQEVLQRSARMRYEARVGRIEEILIEGPSKREPSQVTGRTRQNKIVHVASSEGLRAGAYAEVEITGAAAHYLHAELVEVTAAPRHRRRIPVASA
ncbi:MAG: tRNA (N6-isopentenyl adenosine(37)-C2)-methylthiotransferase MiaB [Actinobacteria bacterium]|jgi:tRNA-2-methylthio-N6-dimethylallyladenosine synthase|nr:tRNA (N6-isopentenyl adenosine(37)-C2)-methylthiotransferase MiaB [Actinomycetota bacterium]MBT3686867.1 tRNA (N6-isopentenyl adenosine(37)-C2)-methylthiotransferase MiaB [Actinomycetota bacterium]MBT4037774.1 tRNA (N6-isopentenyl adenosine(37)-C2)-methylthiotransferase MiaB [Actinomycetota bacterium]MBT4278383.1 tRNA (N6-isopentenyl adenosine(37)-C2)-methylthiotransferase MiaB [Actinomycetota bacterium]MBT4343125.1 tRNA (N6-isopentenyl adenosine(37)-C2)-methylthiotransferase MiaB [Actinomyc